MARHTVTLIPGDGIGPEVAAATRKAVDATGVDVEWEQVEAGMDVMAKYGDVLPPHVFNSINKNGVALKGPITTPVGGGYKSPNVRIRQTLDLYVSLRPMTTIPGVKTRFDNVDLVVVRENSEGLYAGIENLVTPGVVTSIRVTTEPACRRIAKWAFEYAKRHGRKKVTAVHKANIMKMSDGLFLEVCRNTARNYDGIEYEELIVDNTCMQLVTRPERFDVMVMENLFGDIVSDLCAGLVGGLGVTGGANIGDRAAVFEAVHGSAPDIAGKGVANPTALMKSAVMMLDHIGESPAARRLDAAIDAVLAEGTHTTRDLGGSAGTDAFTAAILEKLAAN